MVEMTGVARTCVEAGHTSMVRGNCGGVSSTDTGLSEGCHFERSEKSPLGITMTISATGRDDSRESVKMAAGHVLTGLTKSSRTRTPTQPHPTNLRIRCSIS